jgi:hypothetical protein
MVKQNSSQATIGSPGRKRTRASKKSKSVGTQTNTTGKPGGIAKGKFAHSTGSNLESVEVEIISFSHDGDEVVVVNASTDLGALNLRRSFDSSVTELPFITSLSRPCQSQHSPASCSALELFLLKYCESNHACDTTGY